MEIVIGLCIGLAIATIKPISRVVGDAAERARMRRRMKDGGHAVTDLSLVTVTGTVRALGESLVAPISGTRCVAYHARARLYKHDSPAFARKLLFQQVVDKAVAFTLVTDDGELIVDGKDVEIAIKPREAAARSIDREIAFLRDVGLTQDPANTLFDEAAIVEGMQITVHGIAQVEAAVTGGETAFREAPTRTRIIGDERHPLTIGRA